MPSLSTQTQTLSHRKFLMTDDPSGTIIASTRGFSLSIVATAHFPSTPRSSGHELLPACTQVKYCLSKQTYIYGHVPQLLFNFSEKEYSLPWQIDAIFSPFDHRLVLFPCSEFSFVEIEVGCGHIYTVAFIIGGHWLVIIDFYLAVSQ